MAEKKPTIKIKRIKGETINPGLFYQKKKVSPALWRKLREGKVIEVPEDFLEDKAIHGVEQVE